MVINNLEYITNAVYNKGKIVVQHGKEKKFFWHMINFFTIIILFLTIV